MRARLTITISSSIPGDFLVDGILLLRDRGSRGRNLGAARRFLRLARSCATSPAQPAASIQAVVC